MRAEDDDHSLPTGAAESSEVAPRRTTTLWALFAIIVALAGAAAAALPLLTSFSPWDDEGHMLVSLQHYITEGDLYTLTLSQYGPFYFYAQGVFFQLFHLPLNHNMGRLVTLFYWISGSVLAAVYVGRISKNFFLACAAGLTAMIVGRVLTNEPGHPQQVVLLLLSVGACLSLPARGKYALRFFLLGCVGAALTFTKVNLGVFYIAGFAGAVFCLMPTGKVRSVGLGLAMIYGATAPWLLMRDVIGEGFRNYFLLATIGSLYTFAFGALIQPKNHIPFRAALYAAGGLLAGTALIVGSTLVQGMSLGTLISGVLLDPLNQPAFTRSPLGANQLHLLTAALVSAGLMGLRATEQRLAKSRWPDGLICAVGVLSIISLSIHEIRIVAPLIPLTLLRRPHWKEGAEAFFVRLFITFMATTQFLGPFPVAGSQRGIAALPMLLWAFLCISDGVRGLCDSSRESRPGAVARWRLDSVLGVALLVFFAGISTAFAEYDELPPSSAGLKGASWLHLQTQQEAEFAGISQAVGANCSILFTAPGMGSFNFWSGVSTPNGWNLAPWTNILSDEQQQEIAGILQSNSGACVILNPDLLQFWDVEESEPTTGPLIRYIRTDMPKVAQFGDYEIRVNPNRIEPWR